MALLVAENGRSAGCLPVLWTNNNKKRQVGKPHLPDKTKSNNYFGYTFAHLLAVFPVLDVTVTQAV